MAVLLLLNKKINEHLPRWFFRTISNDLGDKIPYTKRN